MCQYFSKTQDQCSQAMKQAAKEALEDNMHHHDTMIAKSYLSNCECSVQESVYHNLTELKLRRIFPAVYIINISLLEEIFQVLLSEKELTKLRDDSSRFLEI